MAPGAVRGNLSFAVFPSRPSSPPAPPLHKRHHQGPGARSGQRRPLSPGRQLAAQCFSWLHPLPEPSRKEVEEKPWEVCCGAGLSRERGKFCPGLLSLCASVRDFCLGAQRRISVGISLWGPQPGAFRVSLDCRVFCRVSGF